MANFTALKTAINNAIKTNGNEEITGAILQAILDAMVETLGDSAINDLENAITTEVTNRENAVGGVADDLAAEVQARQALDYNVNNRINAEEYNRQNADAALSQTMSQGFQTLGSQMTALNAAISALNAAYQNGYLYGGIATPSSSPSNNKCFYIALQGGTYTNFGGVGVVEGINIIKNDSGWKVEHIYDQTTLLNEFYLLRQQVIRALASYEPIVIHGDVTNVPDEEDLTSNAQHLLKFKDRAYSPLNFSGLGMKILRKNILPLNDSVAFNGFLEGVTAEETLAGSPELIFWDRMNTRFVGSKDGIYYASWTDDDNYVPVSTSLVYMYNGTPYQWTGSDFIVNETEVPNLVNCLTQDMINEANTIYIIRYDYTLKENITIPANCVLEFDGGSISGEHTITGANTGIQAGLVKIFSTDVTIAGTWNVAEAYPQWVENCIADIGAAINKIATLSSLIIIPNGKYNLTTGINLSNTNLKGACSPNRDRLVDINSVTIYCDINNSAISVVHSKIENIRIQNINPQNSNSVGITINSSHISNCNIVNFIKAGIATANAGCYFAVIEQCKIEIINVDVQGVVGQYGIWLKEYATGVMGANQNLVLESTASGYIHNIHLGGNNNIVIGGDFSLHITNNNCRMIYIGGNCNEIRSCYLENSTLSDYTLEFGADAENNEVELFGPGLKKNCILYNNKINRVRAKTYNLFISDYSWGDKINLFDAALKPIDNKIKALGKFVKGYYDGNGGTNAGTVTILNNEVRFGEPILRIEFNNDYIRGLSFDGTDALKSVLDNIMGGILYVGVWCRFNFTDKPSDLVVSVFGRNNSPFNMSDNNWQWVCAKMNSIQNLRALVNVWSATSRAKITGTLDISCIKIFAPVALPIGVVGNDPFKFDNTGKPILWKGTAWVDATGATV